MFKLACHTWGFSDQPLEEAIQTIARLGFNYIDLGSGPHLDADAAAKKPHEEAHHIRVLLDRFHLQITDLYLLLPALSSMDEGRRLYEVKLFERLVPFAVALDTPGITLSPGIALPPPEREPDPFATHPADKEKTPEAAGEPASGEAEAPAPSPPPPTPFDYAVQSLQRIVEVIEDTDLRLSFEPHLDSVAPTPQKALALLEAVPGLSLTLDWAQFTAQGIISREIEPLLPHTAHIQMRQAARGRLQTPYHEGAIDFRHVLEMLVEYDYRGAISIEYMNRSGWHGLAALDVVRETGLTRDALRSYRALVRSAT
jgi:sugar phosphate isomerase/epimerase